MTPFEFQMTTIKSQKYANNEEIAVRRKTPVPTDILSQ